MRIRHMTVRNFGSLKSVDLEDLNEFVVLTGRNGTGKSYLLEALRLFFSEFQPIGGLSSVSTIDYFWHLRRTKDPVVIGLTFVISKDELNRLDLPISKAELPTGTTDVEVQVIRELHYGAGWSTPLIRISETVLIQNNELLELTPPPPPVTVSPVSEWTLYLFPNHASDGDEPVAYLLKDQAATVFPSDDDFTKMAQAGWIPIERVEDQDPESWLANTGLPLEDTIPSEDIAPELYAAWEQYSPDEPDTPPPVLPNLQNAITTAFKLLPASRFAPARSGTRESFLDPEMISSLTNTGTSQLQNDEDTWYNLRTRFEEFVDKELEPLQTQFQVRSGPLRVPSQYIGGGEQAVLDILWQLREQSPIIAIEEPENHLHPSLAHMLKEQLKAVAPRTQFLISTHSPMFVDKAQNSCNWLLTLSGRETVPLRVSTDDDLRYMLAELGLIPSDMFLRDIVLFVEGKSDSEAIKAWSDTLGTPMRDDMRIGILPIGSDSQVTRYLRVWLAVAQHAPSDFRVLLDSHAAHIRATLEADLSIPPDKITILSKHGIEDYYPPTLISEAANTLWKLDIPPDDLPNSHVANFIEARLSPPPTGWKVALATYVCTRTDKKQIDPEFRALIKELRQFLKSK